MDNETLEVLQETMRKVIETVKEVITATLEKVNEILKEAKCNYVSELNGKPVEVILENNTFKDFRILTEVL